MQYSAPVWSKNGLYLHIGMGHVDHTVQIGLGRSGISNQQVERGPQQQGLAHVSARRIYFLGAFTNNFVIVLLFHVLLCLQVARSGKKNSIMNRN